MGPNDPKSSKLPNALATVFALDWAMLLPAVRHSTVILGIC